MLKNKIFPRIKKSIKWFLTDESWKVTKKDVLGISAWTLAMSSLWMESAHAINCYHVSTSPHSSSCAAAPSQAAISGYSGWWHVSTSLRGSSFSYTSWTAWSSDHGNTVWWSAHASSAAPSWWTVNIYNSWWHLSYTSRWSSTSQPSISWYTHSSWSTHSSSEHINGMCE
jgi:hypothetical protein